MYVEETVRPKESGASLAATSELKEKPTADHIDAVAA